MKTSTLGKWSYISICTYNFSMISFRRRKEPDESGMNFLAIEEKGLPMQATRLDKSHTYSSICKADSSPPILKYLSYMFGHLYMCVRVCVCVCIGWRKSRKRHLIELCFKKQIPWGIGLTLYIDISWFLEELAAKEEDNRMVITKRVLCRKKGRKYVEADCNIERVQLFFLRTSAYGLLAYPWFEHFGLCLHTLTQEIRKLHRGQESVCFMAY